jgi:hypothetical protein
MGIFPPSGYMSLRDARDILMRRMHEGIAPSEEIEKYRNDGLHVVDATQAMAAAEALRQPILSGEIGLFALFSSRDTPMRLHNQALCEAALCPSNGTVLTFAYVDRHSQAPFGLSWSDLKELTRDPLCVEERAFRGWVRKQERKKSWPCHRAEGHVRHSRGRPSDLMGRVVEIIEELHSNGKLTPSMRNKEVQALVQKFLPRGGAASIETVRLARKEARIRRRRVAQLRSVFCEWGQATNACFPMDCASGSIEHFEFLGTIIYFLGDFVVVVSL